MVKQDRIGSGIGEPRFLSWIDHFLMCDSVNLFSQLKMGTVNTPQDCGKGKMK